MTKKINIKINIHPFSNVVEKDIKKCLNLFPPESYAPINENQLNNIHKHINLKYKLQNTIFANNALKDIILSLRSTQMKIHMMVRHKYLVENLPNIINDYIVERINILDLVKKYDGSPLNILRIIFQQKYNLKLTKIIKKKKLISEYDKEQLKIAIDNDAYALINQNEILRKSMEFEDLIKNILIQNEVKFKTQSELAQEQLETDNIITNTPDFLILSDFYINDIKINWIDAKNFYGSYSNFMINKINKQTEKYINKWNTGTIIFSLGFNSKLQFDNILVIDYNSLKK